MSTKLPGLPCPYCGRTALVAFHARGIIRCDRPRDADDWLCGSEDCGCTRGQRHTWIRARGQWDILNRMLESKSS